MRFMNTLLGWFFVLAGGAFVLGAPFWLHDAYRLEGEKRAALAGPPPAAVPIKAFAPEDHAGPAGEVTVIGQIAPSRVVERPSRKTSWIAPLLATDAADSDAPALAWIAHERAPWGPDTLVDGVRGRGAAGFAVEINGERVDPSLHFDALRQVLGDDDGSALVIRPFLAPREAELAPDEGFLVTAVLAVVTPLGALVYGLVTLRKARRRAA